IDKCHVGLWRVGGAGVANYESGFSTPNLTITVLAAHSLDSSLLQKAQQSREPVQQEADLGFVSGRMERLGKVFVQAFFMPSAQLVVTFTVFAKHSKFLLQRFAVNQYYSQLFERLHDSSSAPQLQLFE